MGDPDEEGVREAAAPTASRAGICLIAKRLVVGRGREVGKAGSKRGWM